MSQDDAATAEPGFAFVALMALMMSLVALSIDAMLPALGQIAEDLQVVEANQRQLVVSLLFAGMVLGQFVYGPVSDSVGRKRPVAAGALIFIVGCLLAATAQSFEMLLAGRFVQGIGAAGPRIVVVAIIRDRFRGQAMARVMSLIMTVFIVVPALAPLVGQAILLFADWRAIFVMFLLLAGGGLVWFWIVQEETHPPERRRPLRVTHLLAAAREVLVHPISLGYTVMTSLVFGGFIGFLNSAQQILAELYALGDLFPLYFGGLALCIGAAALTNSKLVRHFSIQTVCRAALGVVIPLAFVFLGIAWSLDGVPPLWALMIFLALTFFCSGVLFGNMNALALEPMGHIAGMASGVVASLSLLGSMSLGAFIGANYNGTVLPLVSGFAILPSAAALTMYITEARRPHE